MESLRGILFSVKWSTLGNNCTTGKNKEAHNGKLVGQWHFDHYDSPKATKKDWIICPSKKPVQIIKPLRVLKTVQQECWEFYIWCLCWEGFKYTHKGGELFGHLEVSNREKRWTATNTGSKNLSAPTSPFSQDQVFFAWEEMLQKLFFEEKLAGTSSAWCLCTDASNHATLSLIFCGFKNIRLLQAWIQICTWTLNHNSHLPEPKGEEYGKHFGMP